MAYDPFDVQLDAAVPAPMVENATQRVLRRAKAILQRDGWVQGERGDSLPEGKAVCIGVALDIASKIELGVYGKAIQPVLQAIGRASNASAYTIIDWNDAPERTQQEVFAVLDRAYELARTEG